MIKQDEFYSGSERMNWRTKIKLWREIKGELKFINSPGFFLDVKSFVLGSTFTFAVIVLSVMLFWFIPELLHNKTNSDSKISSAYSSAINELEKSLPAVIADVRENNQIKDLLNARLGQLKEIDTAIAKFRMEIDEYDYSPLIRDRLLRFYQLKIEVINKIITMKGGTLS